MRENGPYDIHLSLSAANALADLAPERRREIEHRLRSIAELAAAGPRVPNWGPPAALMAKGVRLRYVVDDTQRVLTVIELW